MNQTYSVWWFDVDPLLEEESFFFSCGLDIALGWICLLLWRQEGIKCDWVLPAPNTSRKKRKSKRNNFTYF